MDRNKVTRLFLIRHGDTIDEETKKIYKGTIDIPLSAKGITRLKKVSRFLLSYPMDVLYTSTLSRCIESASLIAGSRDMPVYRQSALGEICFGEWEGLSFDEIGKEYPRLFAQWLKNPVDYTPPSGEPLLDAQERIMETFNGIVEKEKGRTITIVSHAGVLKIVLSTLLSLDLRYMSRLAQDYGCVDIIDMYEDNYFVVKLINYTVDV